MGTQKDLRANSLVIESTSPKVLYWLVAQSDNLDSGPVKQFPQKGFFSAMYWASLVQSADLCIKTKLN